MFINIDINKFLKYPKKYNEYCYQYNCLKDIDKLLYSILSIVPNYNEVNEFIHYFKNRNELYLNNDYKKYSQYFESTYQSVLKLYEYLFELYSKINIYNQAADIGNNIIKYIHDIDNNNSIIKRLSDKNSRLSINDKIQNIMIQKNKDKIYKLQQQNLSYINYINTYGNNVIQYIDNSKLFNIECKNIENNIIQYIQYYFKWVNIY